MSFPVSSKVRVYFVYLSHCSSSSHISSTSVLLTIHIHTIIYPDLALETTSCPVIIVFLTFTGPFSSSYSFYQWPVDFPHFSVIFCSPHNPVMPEQANIASCLCAVFFFYFYVILFPHLIKVLFISHSYLQRAVFLLICHTFSECVISSNKPILRREVVCFLMQHHFASRIFQTLRLVSVNTSFI